MIRINQLNKYFNKGKSNEIHVINNTSLEFNNTGLVCILGESGSGKTTLLNTVGGLDFFQNGSITIDDITVTHSSRKELEKVRNTKFGYIFQDRYLLQDCTVVYNIRLALNMYELSEEEKEARIDYVLKSVEMFKYKKRLVSQLSGGQQQRIAIARALVKSPDIIFADEPTGNLDEVNTMRIMSIIRKISRDCLVILVTHEKRIAEFFADRIITIRDGVVIGDTVQKKQKNYQFRDDTNLYLKEFEKEVYDNDTVTLNLYGSKERKLTLNLIYVNDKFYIQTPDDTEVVFLTSKTEMQMIDDYKPILDLNQVEEFDYSLPRPEKSRKSNLKLKELYRLAITNMKTLGRKQIIMIISFIVTALLLVVSLADYLTVAAVDKKSVVTEDSNYINVFAVRSSTAANNLYAESFNGIYDQFLADHVADDIYLDLNAKLMFSDDSYDQLQRVKYTLENFAYVTLEHLDQKDLILGRMPGKRNEVVIDIWLIDRFYESDSILKTVLPEPEDFLGLELFPNGPSVIITGICDTQEPTLYIDKYMGISINNPRNTVGSLEQLRSIYPGEYDDISLADDEVLVSGNYYDLRPYRDEDVVPINGVIYRVAGTYPEDFGAYYVIADSCYQELLKQEIKNSRKFMIYSKEQELVLDYFAGNLGGFDQTYVELEVKNIYKEQLATYEKERAIRLNARFIATAVIFAISMFMLFFTMKSGTIKRGQEISVYRLLGIRKRSILSSFALEIIFMTSTTVLPVVLISSAVIKLIASIPSFQLNIVYPWTAMAGLLGFLYLVNIIVGLLPVYSVIKLPPARIAEKA